MIIFTVLNLKIKLILFIFIKKSNAAITKIKKKLTSYEVLIFKQPLLAMFKT